MLVAEGYPQLKADRIFQWLEKRISQLEEQIADRREFYNEVVKIYNTRLQTIPEAYVALVMRMTHRELFKAVQRELPRIAFSAAPSDLSTPDAGT